jgi:transcriptional/translational regulatory protein YebC/TACO1
MFTKKGLITIVAEGVNEDALTEAVLDAGADDLANNGDTFTVTTDPLALESIRSSLEAKTYKILNSEIAMIPNSTVRVDEKHAATLLKLLSTVEEHDDVSKVWANFDISDEIMERISSM